MSDETQEQTKAPRERSPSFPFIPLKAAIERLQEFEEKFGRNPPPADRVYLAWGYKGNTSQAGQTLAALKAFGLVEYNGSGPKRLVSISDDARTYLRANQESIKSDVLKKIALKPAWIAKMWESWRDERHPDEVCLDELVLGHKFNENSAPTFLRVYDETIGYSGLSDSDKVERPDGEVNDENSGEFQIGDSVNWEINESIQWKQPRIIISIDEYDGQSFYQVEDADGQKGWIPVQQAIGHSQATPAVPPAFTPTPPPADPLVGGNGDDGNVQVKEGSRKAVFPVEEGDVTLIFPENISKDGLDELGQYLNIFLNKEQKKMRNE